ncbi:hypothetical protein K458DRAFT_402360 [Lentithecium fluviatile CBS 122367]|uniref:Uncharacterized protein n=1 Tax=Lentithecium fluviatile CBS 122367 TaxID=1168545 RepID=A0A6G1J8R4_9PLEO|nr:hypothetical protein K458DRAFT_402360 [Lentithecium fluviatile CBS 122367]
MENSPNKQKSLLDVLPSTYIPITCIAEGISASVFFSLLRTSTSTTGSAKTLRDSLFAVKITKPNNTNWSTSLLAEVAALKKSMGTLQEISTNASPCSPTTTKAQQPKTKIVIGSSCPRSIFLSPLPTW